MAGGVRATLEKLEHPLVLVLRLEFVAPYLVPWGWGGHNIMEDEIHDALTNYADDAEVRVVKLDENGISLSISMPSRGNSVYQIRSANVIHIDMAMSMILGHIEFGGLSLLHPTYMQSRNFDYGGRECRPKREFPFR
jgi:hypothetical protein